MPSCCQRRGEVQDHLRCISFLRAVVIVLVILVIISINFVLAMFSSRMYVQQVFSVLFTGVLIAIACVCRRGVSGIFPAGLRLALVSSVRNLFNKFLTPSGRGKCLPMFYRGLMCMCCVCVCAHTRIYCMWVIRMCARVSGRDTWRVRKKSRCTEAIVYIYTVQCTKYTCIYNLVGCRYKTGLTAFVFSFNIFFLSQKRREEDVNKTTITSNLK